MDDLKVVVIGGAPLSGKSIAARMLATRLGFGTLCIDDLGQAIGAVTSRSSHPAFHLMDDCDYREYYVSRSIAQLTDDAEQYHAAIWPAVKEVIARHATWGNPVAIEGWAIRPEGIAAVGLGGVKAIWLVTNREVLEVRVRRDAAFHSGASDEEKMIRHFVARGVWLDERIRVAAFQLGMPTIEVSTSTSAAEVGDRCLRAVGLTEAR